MNEKLSLWQKWKKCSGSLCRWMLIPTVCYLELLFHYWVSGSFTAGQFLNLVGASLIVGSLLCIPAALLPQKGSRWYSAVVIFLCTAVMMVEYMLGDAYNYYMRPTRVVTGAAGVLTDYTDVVIDMIIANWWRILVALLPFLAVILSGKEQNRKFTKRLSIASAACLLAGIGFIYYGIGNVYGDFQAMLSQYDFDASVKRNGLIVSMYVELAGLGNQGAGLTLDIPTAQAAPAPAAQPVTETDSQTGEERVYYPHVIDGLNFTELAETEENSILRSLYSYIASQSPAMENEYTGLFKGKNLIFITAEAFHDSVIDPELTPTLYRLATKGIHFTNYYEPLWTGCTSGGELVNLSGLAMNCEMVAYSNQRPFNTIGRQLMIRGYYSRAYHNNSYSFYDRNITHENLGYEKYIGMGNGMEAGVQDVWPQSDMEMFDFTLPDLIAHKPFSAYYMTVSAHCRYNRLGNAQSKKNWDLVDHLDLSDALKAYYACNLELEKGLTSMLSQLEEAGILDDTVIVLTADHYPYGLGDAWGHDHDCIAELLGKDTYDNFDRDKNALIIWSGCLEDMELQVDTPVCSIDILPTISNLFGVEYDSRLSVGRDVLGAEEAISLWPDYSWLTEYGKYNAPADKFTPFTSDPLPDGYVERISAIVRNKINFSRSIQNCDFFTILGKKLGY